MKVSKLTGAELDYWTARAEGIPAEQLSFRRTPYSNELVCDRAWQTPAGLSRFDAVRYSTDWAQGGPLIDKHRVSIRTFSRQVECDLDYGAGISTGYGVTALEAICRAVVLAAFGDDVDEVPVQPA